MAWAVVEIAAVSLVAGGGVSVATMMLGEGSVAVGDGNNIAVGVVEINGWLLQAVIKKMPAMKNNCMILF
jgi:hypothetical protein